VLEMKDLCFEVPRLQRLPLNELLRRRPGLTEDCLGSSMTVPTVFRLGG